MLVDVQRLQADPSTLSLDTDNDGNFDKNLIPDSVLDMDNLINFDPTHKPKDEIIITDNLSPSSSGGGGGGFPTLPTVVVQSDKLFDSNEIIIQKEVTPLISMIKEPVISVAKIDKTKIAQKIEEDIFEEKIVNEPINIDKVEFKEQDEELKLEATASSGGIDINPRLLLIVAISFFISFFIVKRLIKK